MESQVKVVDLPFLLDKEPLQDVVPLSCVEPSVKDNLAYAYLTKPFRYVSRVTIRIGNQDKG